MRILWNLIAFPLGAAIRFWFWLKERSARISVEGRGIEGPAIYVNWHQHIPHLVRHHGSFGRCMLVSGAPYMAPIAEWCRLSGLKMIRGASGEKNSDSVQQLASQVSLGTSIVLAVDGPAGPAFQAKRGCMEIARLTGARIVPVAYTCRRGKPNQSRWDHSLLCGFFDDLVFRYGPSLDYDPKRSVEDNLKQVEMALRALVDLAFLAGK